MEWFNGSVDDALTQYQNKKGLMIVFVYDDNDIKSTKLGDLLGSLDINVFDNINYVAIRMLKGSENANQFAQFFPTLTVPVCYILGMNAQPLEVITYLDDITSDKLFNDFKKAVSLFKEQIVEVTKKNSPKDEVIDQPDNKNNEENIEKMDDNSEKVEDNTEKMEDNAPIENKPADATTSQEKLEHYRKLLEEKRKADAKKEEEEKIRKEMERRMDGKAMAELREKQRDRELREAAEERRRQKEEDAKALQRLRDQIKNDKEERAAKNNGGGEQIVLKNEQVQVEMNKPVNSDDCRIQCRFPDGSTLKLVFPSKEPLQVIYDAVNQDVRKPSSFFLMQSYPRKKLVEMDKSLLELGLTPSSVLIVVSANSNKNGSSTSSSLLPTTLNYFEMLLGFLFTPFAAIWRFFYSFLNNTGETRQLNQNNINGLNENNNNENKNSNKKKNEGETTVKDGNIRRFKEDSSDHSDTEAMYNGNSTQQL